MVKHKEKPTEFIQDWESKIKAGLIIVRGSVQNLNGTLLERCIEVSGMRILYL